MFLTRRSACSKCFLRAASVVRKLNLRCETLGNCRSLDLARFWGPLLDRIDIHIEVPAVPFNELAASTPGTSSAEMREQVMKARDIQAIRFEGRSTRANAQMSSRQVREFCPLGKAEMNLLRDTVTEMGLSARAHDKIIRVARTIADVEGDEDIQIFHLQEAINYRMLDRDIWS